MSTLQRTRPAVQRTMRFDSATMTLTITVITGRKVCETSYSVERIGSDFGDGFRLTKHVGHGDQCETYNVHLSNDGHACDCKGGSYVGHCKHADALAILRDMGKI